MSTQPPNPSGPYTLAIGQTAPDLYQEFDANGNVIPPVATPTYAADSSGAVSVDVNGNVTGVSATASGAVATVTATDAGDNLVASASFIVGGTPSTGAVSASLTYPSLPLASAGKSSAAFDPRRGGSMRR